MNMVLTNQIKHALEGVFPSYIITVTKDGYPTNTSLSQVCYVDERHIALPIQTFSKAGKHLQEVPDMFAEVVDPVTLRNWNLELKYLSTVEHGPIFEEMAIKLEKLFSLVGMEDLFHLKGAEIYEVVAVSEQ
ncbi:MAG: histidine kinase [Neobacillus sp.]|nr:histidine kinase [Neobacillus sp.]